MMYFAHRTTSEDKGEWQYLHVHLKDGAEQTSEFAKVFGAGKWGYATGLFHDIGKYSVEFQKRLEGSLILVDHSTAGAQAIVELWGLEGKIPAYAIAGHHTGLPNGGTITGPDTCLTRRLKREVKEYRHAFKEIAKPDKPVSLPIEVGFNPGMSYSMFIRMLYSCLVDADFLNTEEFCNKELSRLRGITLDISTTLNRYEQYKREKFGSPKTEIQRYRNELMHECLMAAEGPQGLYTINMPTGSGKTLSSLGFALYHAKKHGLSRIIYVVPFTSIIEQNATILREILGNEVVLEHHSNIQREMDLDEKEEKIKILHQKMELAEENWDVPVIVTTNVQFFESLFSNKRSKCRKLHRIANSIVIFDEAQIMNGNFLKPSLFAMEELARNYKVTSLFCTGTQPGIDRFFPPSIPIKEVVHDVSLRHKQFQRTCLHQLGLQSLKEIASRIQTHHQVMCIVNTRKEARELYQHLGVNNDEKDPFLFHLSARMCGKHRIKVLDMIKERLKNKSLRCYVISTPLIEAGVDIDFPVVYRQLAGLDSIAQAAGRCNRNGRFNLGDVFVFETEQGLPAGWFQLTGSIAKKILQKYKEDGLSLSAMEDYFSELYFYQKAALYDRTDSKNIIGRLNEDIPGLSFPFKDVDRLFKLIDTQMETVIVPIDEKSEELIKTLVAASSMKSVLRNLQLYTVQIYQKEFQDYLQAGELIEVRQEVFVLHNHSKWYKKDIGLMPFSKEHHTKEIFIN
ncbi:CRISPR-associated helicase Cas3 [Brevibacillus laterosporus GI-9]|uniref:CRISPR-associated helicase/endonuclease Cas3 n=1 Tax=Brevibacillus laterosporus TaxID=1465 RepID=UPI000240547E|nr:CRISPR-associated helicase/endonuclease Cas3 [Brevibacillus laterosporus]CCF16786.1 CRISPR-associated helicase Cas3 [Brevibacillus laterosporus GI-9]